MYTKDLEKRMTLRLSNEQMDFLIQMSEMTGMKPSDYVRMMINTQMYSYKKLSSKLNLDEKEISTSNENVKADIDNQLQQ